MTTSAFLKDFIFDYASGGGFSGQHTAGSSTTVLTDENAAYAFNEWAFKFVVNKRDGSIFLPTTNDATTLTGSFLPNFGGSQVWQQGDNYDVAVYDKPMLEVLEFSGLGQTLPLVDVTNHASTAKEYIAGLADGSEFAITCNYLANSADQAAFVNGANVGRGKTIYWNIISGGRSNPSNRNWAFKAINLGFEIAPSVESQNQITFNFKITGKVNYLDIV